MTISKARAVVAMALGFSIAIGLSGCRGVWQPLFRQQNQNVYTADQLRADLISLANTYELQISSAVEEIASRTTEMRQRKDALLWQMIVIPRVRRLAFLPDPKQGFLAMLIVSAAMHDYLSEGEGKQIFGEYQPIAIETARSLEEQAFAIGRTFLDDEQRRKLREQVDRIVAANPVRGTFSPESFVSAVQQTQDRGGGVGWVLNIPMVPVRALTGVSEGAQAIHEFTDTAQYLADVDRALVAVRDLAGPFGTLAGQVQLAGASWTDALREIRAMQGTGDGEAKPDERVPFDIRDYEATAREIQVTSAEIRGLVTDLHGLVDAPGLSDLVARVSSIEESGRAMIDLAAWRACQVVVVFFILLLGYRLLVSSLARRRGA